MAEDCLFCRIVGGEIPAEKVYEDDTVVAFKDIHPAAPHHVLLVPRRHLPGVNDLGEADAALMGRLLLAAGRIARQLSVDGPGYRLVINTNRDAGQVIFHLHMHLLGGRKLGPMG